MKNPISLLVDIYAVFDNAFDGGKATDVEFHKYSNSGSLEYVLPDGEKITVKVEVPDEKA